MQQVLDMWLTVNRLTCSYHNTIDIFHAQMKFTKATVTSQNGPLLSDQIDTNLIFVMGFFAGAAHHKIRNADTKLRVFGYEKIIMNLKKNESELRLTTGR